MKEEATSHATVNTVFIVHLILVIIAWVGPFVFPWYLMVPGYLIIVAQFIRYKRCLMNEAHGLDDSGEHTFYSHLFEPFFTARNWFSTLPFLIDQRIAPAIDKSKPMHKPGYQEGTKPGCPLWCISTSHKT